ncbi:hypothetical protein [Ruminococcus difficilis]|uniref:Uncharacterized protein n=2 Tax=Clostridia TaxID=186801 RepID=A0A934WTF9_9FIRM|nr:hypothetical protein [Ruminococcus difficilis]MBK6089571.1 hypothetical protein [Ruminococcus difficilis]
MMKHYISDIKKQAEKVTTAITGAEMREAVSSAFSDTATALETMEESYRKRGKPLAILLLFWIVILTLDE